MGWENVLLQVLLTKVARTAHCISKGNYYKVLRELGRSRSFRGLRQAYLAILTKTCTLHVDGSCGNSFQPHKLAHRFIDYFDDVKLNGMTL